MANPTEEVVERIYLILEQQQNASVFSFTWFFQTNKYLSNRYNNKNFQTGSTVSFE